jgi:hypothetical protein
MRGAHGGGLEFGGSGLCVYAHGGGLAYVGGAPPGVGGLVWAGISQVIVAMTTEAAGAGCTHMEELAFQMLNWVLPCMAGVVGHVGTEVNVIV